MDMHMHLSDVFAYSLVVRLAPLCLAALWDTVAAGAFPSERQFVHPGPGVFCGSCVYTVVWLFAERESYQSKVEKVQANLHPHLLEETNHRFAGSTPALVDVHNCQR